MQRSRVAGVIAGALAALVAPATVVLAPPAPASADPSPAPLHGLRVSGTDLSIHPAFDPAIERYALTTSAATRGSVTVAASTSDPEGTVLVDGRPAVDGRASVAGLSEGDEISVVFDDAGGVEVHSLVYLPAGFPALTETVPAAPGVSPGHLLLNLSKYAGDGSPSFEAALDRHGVPAYVKSFDGSSSVGDLKPAGAAGHFTSFRGPSPTPGRTGGRVVELDSQFREVRSFQTQNLVNTDSHDSIVRPDGSRILLAYEPDERTGLTDAVIQEVNAHGEEVYTWKGEDHLDPAAETTSPGSADYAHINSIHQMADGDILASFRHLSAVYKIAWHAHDGFARGDVVWRLGGRHSDFTFEHDPYPGGPCAQHSATELAGGHILVFDNGSMAIGNDPTHCVDPTDPLGATIARPQTRVTEYALNTTTHQADLVWSYQKTGTFTYFAGSARRLPGGNTLVGWAANRDALATEVDASGTRLWELKNDDGYLAYRVALAEVPDDVAPRVQVSTPTQGASYRYGQVVRPDFTCTDRGGSSLHTCTGSRAPLATRSPGRHTYQVKALDGAGNPTTLARSYTVGAAPYSRPDAIIRGPHRWVGNNVFGSSSRQQVGRVLRPGRTATTWVRLQNQGNRTDRTVVRGSRGSSRFAVRYYLGSRDVTALVRAGTLSRTISANRSFDLRVEVTRRRPAHAGSSLRVTLVAHSGLEPRRRDAVAVTVRAIRRGR